MLNSSVDYLFTCPILSADHSIRRQIWLKAVKSGLSATPEFLKVRTALDALSQGQKYGNVDEFRAVIGEKYRRDAPAFEALLVIAAATARDAQIKTIEAGINWQTSQVMVSMGEEEQERRMDAMDTEKNQKSKIGTMKELTLEKGMKEARNKLERLDLSTAASDQEFSGILTQRRTLKQELDEFLIRDQVRWDRVAADEKEEALRRLYDLWEMALGTSAPVGSSLEQQEDYLRMKRIARYDAQEKKKAEARRLKDETAEAEFIALVESKKRDSEEARAALESTFTSTGTPLTSPRKGSDEATQRTLDWELNALSLNHMVKT